MNPHLATIRSCEVHVVSMRLMFQFLLRDCCVNDSETSGSFSMVLSARVVSMRVVGDWIPRVSMRPFETRAYLGHTVTVTFTWSLD